ncbi:leukocyte cell-derived chemotaxin-2-like [Oculina patagonica]
MQYAVIGPPGGSSNCFAQICSSNPSNRIRGCDRQGCGGFGASRGSRSHRGIDVVCSTGSRVYSPFPATVIRRSNPYVNSNAAYNTGIYLQGTGAWSEYRVKMWYVTKGVGNGASLSAGSPIGYMTNRAANSPGMTNHVHVQLEKNGRVVNPTSYAC